MNKFSLNKLLLITLYVIAMFGFTLTPNILKAADYCEPYYYSSGYYMGINYVEIGEMSNSSEWEYSPGYNFYSEKKIVAKLGSTLDFYVEFGNSYAMEMVIWIDWNGDGKFDKNDFVWESGWSYEYMAYKGQIKIPDDAQVGTTRLRIMTEYSGGYYPSDPCGTYDYGECEDYPIEISPNSPDASITSLTSPVKPFRVGNHQISAVLKSGNKAPLKNVKIDWFINNVQKGTFDWKGTLNEGQTTTINFGTTNLDYADGSNYGPFNFRFVVREANGFEVDANPDNDVYSVNLSPILNDAGVIGFFGPPEGFGPGITQVRARVRNYAPKPLTSITINWKIDGVAQTPVTLTGLNIKRDETQDLILGTYNFYAKTPLVPFTVECVSSNPNGVTDEDQSNDKYNGGIGPSLAAGTYTIGGSAAHFSSPSEAASYINSSGIFGAGEVIFNVNQGNYVGQIVLNNPLPNKNPITFNGMSQFNTNVVISAAPTAQNNFIVLLNGMSDISFNNLTFTNMSSNTSGGGNIISATNTNGLEFEHVVFNGIANSPRTNQYALINLTNCNNITIYNNTINNGSIAINSIVNTPIYPTFDIIDNDFYNFSMLGIRNQIADGILPGTISITDNRFISNAGLAPTGGIASWNATSINRNEFNGIVGTGAINDAVIYVKHTQASAANNAEILENRINSATNCNGILVDGAYTFVNRNYMNINQTANYGLAALRAINSFGTVSNNQIIGKDMIGINVTNSPELDFYYNSIISESNTYPTAMLNGAGDLMRNIFFNNGTGRVYQVMGSTLNSNQNVFFTKGSVLINDNGMNYNDLTPWQAKQFDTESDVTEVEFESFNNLFIKYYSPSLLTGYPLFPNEEGYYINVAETYDFNGDVRKSYFIGSHELELAITIERQTEGFVDCAGATDNILSVSSAINYNAPMTYQWEFDGSPIQGATEPILYFKNLRHNQAGVYKCLIDGPGATESVYSQEVAVYVIRPTEITSQPQNVELPLGETVVFSFEAHVNGRDIESAIANNEVSVRWYKYVDEANDIPLVDNGQISGSRSNFLTINSFRLADEGSYYAVIDGKCNSVKSEMATLSQELNDLTIVQQPVALEPCEGTDVMFIVNAETQSGKNILYQWYKDGELLNDNLPKLEGTKSKHLTFYGINDDNDGTYYVIVSLEGTNVEVISDMVTFNTKHIPTISLQPQNTEVEAGSALMIDVIANGNSDVEILTYKWYHNGNLIQESEIPSYSVETANSEHSGSYYVVVSNECGEITSNTIEVIVTTGTTDVANTSKNGYSLSSALPNPVNANAVINFDVPTESLVKIVLTDLTGTSNVVLTETTYAPGNYSINVDTHSINLNSGTYIYYLESNGVRLSQKMVVIK